MATDLILSEQDRNKLDAIVMRMTVEKEKPETIQFVVNDFKQKYGTASQMSGASQIRAGETGGTPQGPYAQFTTPDVMARYGLTPEQYKQDVQTVQQDIRNIPLATARTAVVAAPAVAGSMLGAPLGPMGAVAGGALGYGAGSRLEELLGLAPQPQSVGEGLSRSVSDVSQGAIQEMTGGLVSRGYEKFLAPRAGKITPQGAQLSETAQKAGFTPDPTDVAPGRTLRSVSATAEKQIGGGRIGEAAQREVQAMRGNPVTGEEGYLTKEARAKFGPQADASAVERGTTIQNELKAIKEANTVGEAVEWEFPKSFDTGVPDFSIDNLREHMRQRMVERGTLRQAVNPQTSSQLSSSGGSREAWTPEATKGARGGQRTYDPAETGQLPRPLRADEPFVTERATRSGMSSSEMIAGLAQGEGPITAAEAKVIRKALGEMYEQGDRAPLMAFRQDMTADATKNPARAQAWEEARNFTRENIVPFHGDQPLGRLIDKGEPTAVFHHLLQPKDANITSLRAVLKQTGGQGPAVDAIRAEAVSRAIEKPGAIANIGPETRKALFTKEQNAFLDELLNWSRTSTAAIKSKRTGYEGTGQNIVTMDQFRHGLTLMLTAGGGYAMGSPVAGVATGAAILLTPNLVARMMTNPTTVKWLTQGFKTPSGSAEAIRISSQLLPAYFKAMGEEKEAARGR